MGNSYGLKGKGVDLSQGPPKRERDGVQIPAVIETPLVPAENASSSSGWHSNVALLLNFMMSLLCTVFSWAFPCKDIVQILLPLRHLWSLLKMLLQALDGTAMWRFFLIL
jgi:hypothetical protein